MIGRRSRRPITAIIVALIFTVSMIVAVPPVQAANMSVELLNPAATLESDNGTTVTYTVNQDMDSNSIVFQWNFGNGIDTNWNTNIGLVTLAEDGGAKIALDSSDFTYTKADTPVKLRQMELNLKSTALEPGKDYTVTLGAAIAANNGTDSLGKDYVWKFSTASAGVVEITAFDSIADVNAGTAGAASYADAAAVQAVLPDSVTANAGAVTVPVTAWEDTDLYDPAAAGSYTFTAVLGTIPDGYANTGGSTATAEVIVEAASTADITPPEIILTGNSEINLSVGDPFIEPGYTAIDDVDGDITDNVVVGGDTVDTDTAGTYIITYNVSDAAGNEATEATRTVTVSEKVSTPYTAQQGIGAFQLMLTSVPATDIEVKEATDTYYENVIKTLYAPSSVINFDITITGSGGNTYPLATAVTRVFPYIKILDATKTNVIAEYSSGTGALKCNETAVAPSGNGTTFKMVLDADTLAPNTQYYLYIDPDLQNKQTTPIKFGKSIYFEFKTGAAVPSAPNWSSNAALTVSDVTGTGFNLSWPEASGAEAYKVIVSNTTGGVTINVLDTAISEGTACTVTGLTANRHYDIKVTATNIAGDSPASLSALAVTTPDKTLFTFVSGVPNSTSRYGFMPSGTVASETIFEKVYTYNDTLDSVNSRFFWYLQAGFNNTNARDHVDSFRLFNLTDNEEIDLDYGTTNFGLGTASWTASGITESDTGYTLISEMTSGDFKVAKIQPSSVWMRFELDIAEYLEAGKEYAITIDPQFHTGGANPTVLGKIYTFAFTTSTPDNQYPTWGSGAAITASDITGSGFTVSYPAANDNVGVVKYNIVLKQGSETVSSESITGLSKVFTGLDEATNYTVSVDAEDAAGNKSAVLNTGIRTLSVVPTWGTDAALTLSNVMATDVTINWPYSNTPEIVAGYALFVNGTEEERFRPTDYYCELGGLTSSTKYVFELKPFNKQGQFGEAISAMAVTDGAAVLNYTTTFVVEEIAGGEYYRNYLIKYPIDLTNFAMGWNFSNGIDTHLGNNLAGIRIYEKDTGTEIVLDKGTAPYAPDTDGALMAGDFRYTKSGGGDQGTGTETKIRLLLFKPSAATLAQFTPGKEYVLEMQPDFISNNGENTLSKITTFTFSIAPEDFEAPVWPAEAALEAVKIGPESIVIKWPAATDNFMLKEYQLQVNGGQSTVIDVQANPSYQLTGLSPDTEYALSLEAVDTKNNKSVPLVINVSTLLNDLTAPFWPVGSKLSVKNIAVDNANLSWTAADDNVEVTGYKVYNANVLLKETNALQLHITGLVPATTYVFRIEAVDQAGNMSSTGPISIIRTLEGKPDTNPPQWNGGGSHSYSTTADYSNAYVTINWPWATDNVAVREYQVYLEGELIATVSSIANSYSGTLPLDGSYHNYEVYACDASGNVSAQPQSFSILAGQLPDDLVAPYWPAGNEIIISDFTDKTAVISWSEAADNKGVVAYLLKRDQLWVVWVDQTENYPGYMSFEDRTIWYDLDKLYPLNLTYKHPRENLELVEGEPYSCSMKAFDALGNSSIGGPKITFYPGTDPTAGSGIEFALSNVKNSRGTLSSLTGAMNLVDDPTDPELTKLVFDFACKLPANYAEGISLYDKATGVQVALAPENLIYTENGETSQLTIDPGVLTAESTYVIKFSKAFSSSTGTSIGFDLGWEFITASADKEIPTWGDGAALNVDFLISPMTATLSWSAAIDNLQVTQYKLFKGEEVLAVLPGETREYLAEDLSVATEYTFKVQAGDYLNNWSTLLEKTMTSPAADITPPGWGTGTLSFTNINSDNVTLNWSAASGEYAVKDYLIYKNDDSQPSAMVGSDVFTYLAGGLTGETSYTFKIVARDYSGNLSAPLSNDVITAVDNVLPTWPVNAFLNAKDLKSDSFTLYWQAALDNIGIDHYNIYQDGEMIGSTADSTTTEYPIAGLEATTKYTFMVEAVDTSDNKTADKLIFEQSTTVSGPTEGAGIEFTMTSPANENVGKSGNAMLNRVTEPMLDANIIFTFDFAKDLASSTLLANVELVENDDVENPIQLQAEYFSYTFANGIGALKLEIPQNLVDMGTSYQLKLMSSLEAKDGSTLGKDYIWEFNVAQGLYGIKDIAAGVNSYSAFESAADRFYLMVKSDGTVWGWGNNLYGHLGDGTTQDSAVPVQALNLQNITKVVAGVNSAFAVDADGGVWGWGSNEHGQLGKGTLPTGTSGRYGNETPQKIAGLPPIAKLVYGFNRCVALDVNGDVWTWGFRTSVYQSPYGVLSTGTPAKVPFLSNIKDVATGWQTSLAVTADGKVWEWAGIDGTPAEVDGLTEVKSVAMDSFNYTKNNMALKKDGTLWYWGEGTIVVTIPGSSNKLAVDLMQVEGAENVKEIYTKSMAVLTDDRSVRSVDVDFAAKSAILGDVISNLTDISKLAVYTTSSRTNPVSGGLALKLDGTLLQFIADVVVPIDPGMNAVDPPVWPDESAVIFSNLTEQGLTLNWNSCREGISAYAVYQNGSLVKTLPGDQLSYSITGLTKGQAYTFKVEARMAGSNFTANGPSASVTLTDWNPTMQGAGKIAAGTGHSLMIDADGSVWAWGSNESGQLGIGSNADQLTPQKIEGLNNITAVAVGNSHSLALDGEGNVWVWGSNTKYQLGLGTTENRNVPVKLAAISGVTGISAAGNYNLAVKSDGTLWSWGEPCNANLNYAISGIDGKTPGQMKYGTPSPAINYYYQNVKSAVASPNFYAVLFADGTISRSGSFIDNVGAGTYWTMLYNPGLMGVQAISAGNDFLMALLEDGTVAVMGDNSQGQYGNGTRINPTPATAAAYKKVTGLESVVAISAGGAHGLALKADGSVWGWGQNNKGQIGNGNTTTQLIPTGTIKISDIYVLDAGSSYSIVLKDDTAANIEAYAFGDNSKGQLGTGSTLSSTEVKRIIFPGFVDNIAPTFPAWFAIYAIGLSDNSATILWSEAEDNTAVATYEIWQDNVKVGEVTGDKRAFTVTGLISGQTYEIGIKALDTAGNISSLSRITKISIDNIVVDGNSGVSLRLPNQEVTVPNNSFLDVSSGLAVKSNDTIQVGGQSIDLTQFAIEGESQQNLTQPVNVGDQQVTIAQAVQLKSAIATQPTIIKNAAVTNISASISDGTTILAPQGWDGTIKPPTNVTTAGTAPSGFTVGNSVIEVGSPNGVLIFDKPVILTLTGVTGSNFGYKPAGSNTWVKMSQAAGTYDNPTAPAFPGEAYITNGTDTKIITWHFTQFASLSEVSTSGSGSSGGGSGSGEGSGTVGGLSVSYTVNKNAVQNVVLRFDFSNGIDNNLTSNLNLIRVYEKSTGNNVNYSDYEYIKEGSQDTGNKIRRLELYFDNLKSSTNYIVELGGGFKANNGSTLGVKNAFEFTTIAEATSSGQTNTETGEKVETPVTPINVLKLNDIAGHWAEKSITKLVASGAISGYPDGDFKPDAKITRAEFVTVLVKAFKLETKTGKLFNDTTNSWAKDYIATANAYGIVNGYDDLSFGPDDLITREQMIVMLIKAARLTSATSQTTFTDSDSISSWARNSIAIAIQNSLIKGYPDNTFGPSLNASRAEGITVLCNALN